jgi:hypothetical protein
MLVSVVRLHCHSAGIQGVLDAYRMCVTRVTLYGPTNFAPIILHVAQFAAAAKKENNARVGELFVFHSFVCRAIAVPCICK